MRRPGLSPTFSSHILDKGFSQKYLSRFLLVKLFFARLASKEKVVSNPDTELGRLESFMATKGCSH